MKMNSAPVSNAEDRYFNIGKIIVTRFVVLFISELIFCGIDSLIGSVGSELVLREDTLEAIDAPSALGSPA